MPTRRRLCAAALVASVLLPLPAAVHAGETSPANVAAARRHFEKARADYGQGAYKEAITELEAAHDLDPNAKDLVFNLGVVHEKLADIDEALKWFRLYTSMNLTAQERDRADAYIKRLEGARHEVDAPAASASSGAAAAPSASSSSQDEQPSEPPPPHGRIDAFTIAGAGVAVVGLGVGTIMGIKALSDRPNPQSHFVTGQDGSYQDLTNRTNTAHTEAVVSDVAFGVGIAAAAVTAYLFFGRRRDPSQGDHASVSAAPAAGGGAVFVQGSF